MGITIQNEITGKMKEYKKLFQENDLLAKKQTAVTLLGFVINGSPKESGLPPIDTGMLRGSASIFVGSNFIAGGETTGRNYKTDYQNKTGSGTDNNDIITVGFNVPYAVYMHEHKGNWGQASKDDGDVKNKFLERHMQKDGKILCEAYALFIKRNLNKGS